MATFQPTPEPTADFKLYSCLTCRQRKVRCDRQTPCSNCLKAEKQCSFVAPVRGKRKRTKPRQEGLHAKLKRYEELLKSYGASVDPSEDCYESDTEDPPQREPGPDRMAQMQNSIVDARRGSESSIDQHVTAHVVTAGTSSRYFDNAPWTNLGQAFEHPEAVGLNEPHDRMGEVDEHALFLRPESDIKRTKNVDVHPSVHVLIKLKQIYADRVDPLMKILHFPTFWSALMPKLQNRQQMSRSLEALALAFYLASVSAMTDTECKDIFDVDRTVISSQYRAVARDALANAKFLSTSDLMTLQAYALFLMCIRHDYACDTLFVLSGLAIRLALKMGLHRDGTHLGLSPFETEMRRRLWWHLVIVDFKTADTLCIQPSLDLSSADTQLPTNTEDNNLYPEMSELPVPQKGITSATLSMIKCEGLASLRKFSSARPGVLQWEVLRSGGLKPLRRDNMFDEFEDHFERTYLRYCDPSITLHTFISIATRAFLCKMRLLAHNPQQFAGQSAVVPQRERDIVFENARKLLEYIILIQSGHNGLENYQWHIGMGYFWNTMLYLLIETLRRRTGAEVDRSWQLIGTVFSYYPQIFNEESAAPVYIALAKWTLEVWDQYVTASKAEQLNEPKAPDYIDALRRRVGKLPTKPLDSNKTKSGLDPIPQNSFEHSKAGPRKSEGGLETNLESFSNYEFPSLMSFEVDPNEWVQWEQLLAEQGNFEEGSAL